MTDAELEAHSTEYDQIVKLLQEANRTLHKISYDFRAIRRAVERMSKAVVETIERVTDEETM